MDLVHKSVIFPAVSCGCFYENHTLCTEMQIAKKSCNSQTLCSNLELIFESEHDESEHEEQ